MGENESSMTTSSAPTLLLNKPEADHPPPPPPPSESSPAESPVPGPSGTAPPLPSCDHHDAEDEDDDAPPYAELFPASSHCPYTFLPTATTGGGMCSSSISNENVNCLYSPLSGTDTSSLQLPVYDSKSNLSDTASAIVPICRICHQPGEGFDILISPCRCAGTLQFIHNTCLMRWLEITSKKSRKPPKCELCHYQYNRHKKFKLDHWRFPRVSQQDKVLHCIFIVNLLIMIGCAIATVMCFLSDKGQISKFPRNKATLTTEEIITLSCGVLFFVSFFIAMSVQIKARRTLYQLFVKFIMQNMEWEIDEYDKSKDSLYSNTSKDLLKSPAMFV